MAALLRTAATERDLRPDGRVLIVGSGVSGMSVAARMMGSVAVDEGIETVIAFHRGAATRQRALRPQSARLDIIQAMRHQRRWLRTVAPPAKLRAVFDRFAGVVICGPGPLLGMAAALQDSPTRSLGLIDVTVPLHADQNGWPDVAWVRRAARAERAALAAVDHVGAISSWCGWSLVHDVGLAEDRVSVVALSARRPHTTRSWGTEPRSSEPLRLIVVGQPAVRKGMDRVERWLAARPDVSVELHLAGATYASPDRRVINHGAVPHERLVSELLPSMDLLVHPTRRDQSSRVIVEAAMAGVPAVAMAVGGIPELIHHDRTGWLVQADSRAELARNLDALVADPDRIRRAGLAAARWAEAFDADLTYGPVVRWLAGWTGGIAGRRPYDWGLHEQ